MSGDFGFVTPRSRWPALPIRLRLTLWNVALLAAILLVFSVYLYLSLSHSLSQELDASLRAAAMQTQATVDSENGLSRLDRESVQLVPDTVVTLYDRSGQTLVDGSPRWVSAALNEGRARAASGEATFSTARSSSNERWRILATPVGEGNQTIGVLEIGRSTGELEAALNGLLFRMAFAVPATLLLAAGGSLFLAGRALSPVDRITRLARRIEAEDLSRRLALPPSRDEVGRLAETFDDMLDRLDRAFRRQHQFTADASHELRTPLAVITSQVDVTLGRTRPAAEYREALRVIGGEAERLGRLVSELLALARADAKQEALEREPVSLDVLAREVVEQLRPLAAARGIRLEIGRAEPAVVAGDQTRLLQLLLNLADNALKYTPSGSVTVSVRREARSALLIVADTGVGIAAEHLSHLFERFYRVDKVRSRAENGTGLGLAICDWIARAHGGRIEVASEPGRGSTFTVYLPLCVEPEARPGTHR